VGGDLSAGDLVGVFVTIDDDTHLTLHKVLVTRVQGAVSKPPAQTSGSADAATDGGASGDPSAVADPIPGGSLMVTVAVSASDAEKLVYAAEHAKIYLSLENAQSTDTGTSVVNKKKVFQ
jgi:pilus assembly protein CpaB